MEAFLKRAEKEKLLFAHKGCKNKRHADRIKTILHLNEGEDYKTIAKWLLIDDSTIRDYFNRYQSGGLEALLNDDYGGGLSYLNTNQLKELEEHLTEHMYLYSKEIKHYIEKKYDVIYTPEGIRALLKRLDFVYKKTKHLPGKGDLQKQKEFVKKYKRLKATKGKDDEIYFMDGVHPLHNSMNCNGWIKKGTEKAIRANTGRDRLNINGACNVAKGEVIIHEDVSVNAQSTIALFEKMKVHQPKGKIFVIADNARYYRSKLVTEYVKKHKRIKLIFLPSYSPNLNLIERLWKFFKKKILYDSYYEKFVDFKNKTISFFENISIYKEELLTLLKDNFYYPIQKFSKT